ncbi:MAG: Glu-tRNA(Gln) amidotransferase subunit GatE [Candidatus Poseidoniia archaeon]|nr:Glu-tRNA(Gln) amidotransferase subunit GatE [Candidatus Poseidoniia archaeon]
MTLTAGLEVHQQLDCGKLFCSCPAETSSPDPGFNRRLHATASEMGQIDTAAAAESVRDFGYHQGYGNCLVEADEEPPRGPNPEAVKIALQVAQLLGAQPLEEIHFMRKVVVDGSNTTGFQRTALVSTGGRLEYDGGGVDIEQLCLEEDSCRRGDGKDDFLLDRLGVPLLEISTAPQLHTPEAVQAAARALGRLLRACRVRRGLGTIRQDVNVSIPEGRRVELKGFQDLGTMPQVVEDEMERQTKLAEIARSEPGPVTEVTQLLANPPTSAWCCRLPGWAGLLGTTKSPLGHQRLGRELADHVRRAGVTGLLHSDEIPAQGVSVDEAKTIAAKLKCGETDAFILVFEKKEVAMAALERACNRARKTGVPHEVRRVLTEGGSRYLRPMPGAARMYPETDIPPLKLAGENVELPPTLDERSAALPLGAQQAEQLVRASLDGRFHELVTMGSSPKLAARLLLHQLPELRKAGLPTPSKAALEELLEAVASGKLAKEGVDDALATLARGEALQLESSSDAELDAFIDELLAERKDFVQQRRMEAMGPLMGTVMGEFRGRIDGALVSERLLVKLEEFLG